MAPFLKPRRSRGLPLDRSRDMSRVFQDRRVDLAGHSVDLSGICGIAKINLSHIYHISGFADRLDSCGLTELRVGP